MRHPVGVLALQGCIDPHIRRFAEIGVNCAKVRSSAELDTVDRLVLPGGESTTMFKLIHALEMAQALRDFAAARPVWGICAGAILLAQRVENPSQASLGVMQISAQRNFYGSQRESFNESVAVEVLGRSIAAQFIRAPLLRPLSEEVEILARRGDQGLLFKEGRALASAFHTELGRDTGMHRYFLTI